MTQNTDELKVQVTALLAAAGWKPEPGTAIASKFYDTYVGPRQAQVYLSRGDEYNRTLSGQYYSEGRDATAACLKLIPHTATPEQVAHIVSRFMADMDATVAQTYAARLLRTAA